MNRSYPTTGYAVPKKNTLLISCIDLRLADDLVRFMEHENLTNRYDHFILAGASLSTTLECLPNWRNTTKNPECGKYDVADFDFVSWQKTLDNHLDIALALHHIEDVYIVEHENCGAYKAFVDDGILAQKTEKGCQHESVSRLAEKIEQAKKRQICQNGTLIDVPLTVHCFWMDLRGNVELMQRLTLSQPCTGTPTAFKSKQLALIPNTASHA